MDKILVDTNIVLDLLAKRESFFIEAQELFTLSDKKKIKLFVSSLTFANTYYVLSQSLKIENARKILRKFKVLVEVLPMDDKIIDSSLDSDFNDFEDAIQYYSAIENDLDLIITRNLKDFKQSKIPVLTAKDYLATK
ncbi:MAG: PIN domain-containing protein [Fulvivirga sp.]